MRLKDKIAVVTGSSRGIGRAIAERLAKEGALVVVHYGSNSKAADETVRAIKSESGAAFALPADLASVEEIQRFFRRLDEELTSRSGSNQFDILVNNAGIASPASYREMTAEQFDHLFAVNVRGAFFVTQAAIPRLRNGARIVNISSIASRHASPSPMTPPYSMTKAALDAFTLGLAQDLGQRGIIANTIAPGAVETDINVQFLQKPEIRKVIEEQTALRRIGQTTDVANVAAFLVSDDNTWVTGQYIEAGGGFRL
jgi:3-oxoacyl-[acyl-carrier protein] reductase